MRGRYMTKIIRAPDRLLGLALFLILTAAGLHALEDLPLVNTETVSLAGIENLSISYGHDDVILRESDTEDLVIKEYASRDHARYYVRVSRAGGTLSVKRGLRPWLRWLPIRWKARAEIYIPRSFRENLRISNSSGNLSGDTDLLDYKTIDINLSSGSVLLNRISGGTVSIHVSSGGLDIKQIGGGSFVSVSSGRIQIGALTGGEHRVKVSSGRLRIGALEGSGLVEVSSGAAVLGEVRGKVEAHVSSGSLTLENFSGNGDFQISSGSINLGVKELTGDLRFRVSSGGITANLPAALSFNLDAVTKSGRVLVNEEAKETLRVSGNSTVLRPLGPSPERTIYARTFSGNVTINRR
jgi:DUF4097 and DUF4098 domain-containing protein YvlB